MKFFVLIILLSQIWSAQAQHILRGKVVDCKSGLAIENVSVTNTSQIIHAITNTKGEFQLNIPACDSLKLIFRHLSFNPLVQWVHGNESWFRCSMNPLVVNLNNVRVSVLAQKKKRDPMNSVVLSSRDIEHLPAQLGEVDVIKVLEIQPGVLRTSELNPVLHVRGGSGDQNSFLLDGQPIFNPNHMMGIMSTFNADLVEQVSMEKNGFHPSLGGSLSSFIHVKNRLGNKNHIAGKVGVGLLSSRLMLEGPLKKGKSSFIIGARRSYLDLFSNCYNKINEGKKGFSPMPDYSFSDIQFKMHVQLSDKLYGDVQGFGSFDQLDLVKEKARRFQTDWQNRLLSFHLRYYPSQWFHLTYNLGYGYYAFFLDRNYDDRMEVNSHTSSWNQSLDAEINISSKLMLSAGLFSFKNRYGYDNTLKEGEGILKEYSFREGSIYAGGYLHSCWNMTERMRLDAGIRINGFFQGRDFIKGAPRLSFIYEQKNWGVNINVARTYQFNHLISSYGLNLPNDIWYPSGKDIPEEKADQISLGAHGIISSGVKIGGAIYWKKMNNQIDYKEGADLLYKDVTSQILLGKGEARGFELNFNMERELFSFGVNYTFADTWRQFDQISEGRKFHPPFDVTHNINVMGELKLSSRWTLSSTWFFASGQNITFPVGAMVSQGFASGTAKPRIIPLFGDRYNVRMKPTHRLDIAFRYIVPLKKGRSILSLGIYNVYNRANPYFIYFGKEQTKEDVTRIVPKQKALIPFLPTFNYTYEFH